MNFGRPLQVSLPTRGLCWFIGLMLTTWWGFSFFDSPAAQGAPNNVTVCMTKSKTLVASTSKKTCRKGERRIVLSSRSSANLCVNSRSRQITMATNGRCPSGRVPASTLTVSNSLPMCTNSRTRQIQVSTSGTCPRGFTTQQIPMQPSQTAAIQNPTSLVPATTSVPVNNTTNSVAPTATTTSTTSTIPSVTTTSTTTTTVAASTTTTSVPPATIASFTAANTTINAGGSTTLSAVWSGSTGTIDQSVGSITSGASVTVSPTVTTTYVLTASNGAGHSITQSVTVEVNSLSISVQPQNITTANVSGENFSVTAVATGALTYQWYKDSSAISGANNPAYRATQNGSYYVVITSTLNGVSRTATSSTATFALNSVSISSQPTPALVGDNETTTFSVSASGAGTLSYQWRRDNSNISGATSSTYTTDVGGVYQVVVTSTLNGVTTSVSSNNVLLDVNTVTITSSPSDANMTQGGSRTLAVSVSSHGSATISYLWYRDNSAISGATSNSYSATQGGTYKVRVTSTRGGTTAVRFSTDAVITEVAAASISSVTASPASITPGNSTSITAVFSGGTAVLTPGNTSLTSGTPVSVSPSSTTLYTVTATNSAGQQTTATVNIVVTTGTFSATANNSSTGRRWGANSVTLQSGKVLVFGSNTYSRQTDVYDPTTNTFTRVGDLQRGRALAQAVRLPNGKVLAISGQDSNTSYTATVEIFDPATETWSDTGSLATGRSHFVAVALSDGKVLVTGGITTGNTRLASTEIYDPATGQFSPAASMPQARNGASGTRMADGNVFVAGGTNTVDGSLTSAIIYNVSTDTWSTIPSLMSSAHANSSTSFGGVSLLLQDGRILVAGGWATFGVPTIDIYNPTTNSFVDSATIPQFSFGGSATAHVMNNGLVVFFGGSGASYAVSSSAYIYDPISNTMTAETNGMMRQRYMHTSAKLNDGRVIVIGGASNDIGQAEVYTP